jgi:chromosome partitioning protein
VIEFMGAIRKLGKPAAFVLTKVNRRAGSFLKAKQLLSAAGRLCPMEVPLYEDIGFAAEVGVGVSEIKGARGVDDVTAVWTFVKQELGL